MRFLDIIREKVADDVSANGRAMAAYHVVAKAVEANKFIEIELTNSRRNFYALEPNKIGLTDVPDDLLIMIGLRTSNLSVFNGAIWKIGGEPWMGKYSSVLVIYGLRNISEEELKKCVNSTAFLETFQHEFIHIIDGTRTQGRISKGGIDSTNRPLYFNDPAEFNAYFHQYADNWLDCLRELKKNPEQIDDYMDLYNITGNFQNDLKKMILKSNYSKEFFETLNDVRRKSILRRLYRVYQEILSYKNK